MGSMMRLSKLIVVVTVVLLALLGVLPAGAVEPVKVFGTKADEWRPAASDEYLAWTVWTGSTSIVYAKPFGGARMRVSPKGYDGWSGAIDGSKLVYQRASIKKGISDIYLFDLVTKRQTKLPRPVNTGAWEYYPSMSGDLIAFARRFKDGSRKVYVWNRATNALKVIAKSSKKAVLEVGQVNGNYVVFDRWGGDPLSFCEVYRYNVTTGSTTRIPNPNDRCQWGSSVDPSGTVYFGRSPFTACNVTLRAFPVGGPVSTIASLPRGRDFSTSDAVDNGDGTTDVYFDPFRCTAGGGGPGDIHKVTLP
jgi:hypothetical protein